MPNAHATQGRQKSQGGMTHSKPQSQTDAQPQPHKASSQMARLVFSKKSLYISVNIIYAFQTVIGLYFI